MAPEDETRCQGSEERVVVIGSRRVPQEGSEGDKLCCASGEAVFDAIQHALSDREHVVMVRVSDDIRDRMDMLVEAGICKSRSSAATFMLHEGIKANAALFGQVEGTTKQIADLKAELRQSIGELPEEESET